MTDNLMGKILLVEDDPNDAELALRALKRCNLAGEVRVLDNGEEALEYLFSRGAFADRDRSEDPRVVILDLHLPRISGLDVLKTIKSNGRTRNIPVVILSSSREESDVITCYRLGVNGYVVKPVDFEAFQKAVLDLGLYWARLNELPQGNGMG